MTDMSDAKDYPQPIPPLGGKALIHILWRLEAACRNMHIPSSASLSMSDKQFWLLDKEVEELEAIIAEYKRLRTQSKSQ